MFLRRAIPTIMRRGWQKKRSPIFAPREPEAFLPLRARSLAVDGPVFTTIRPISIPTIMRRGWQKKRSPIFAPREPEAFLPLRARSLAVDGPVFTTIRPISIPFWTAFQHTKDCIALPDSAGTVSNYLRSLDNGWLNIF